MSDRALYLRAAEDLRDNPGQWEAYNSTGHCVVLAGPGSGKTKTLIVKLARTLNEDVQEPRGLACITYNNECARELENRLDLLGIEPSRRVFVGTVHSFSLTQIILPYAKAAGLGLPDDFRVATLQQQRKALERAFNETIRSPENPQTWRLRMDRYRRDFLNRNIERWRSQDAQLADLIEAYEAELRAMGLIDFDDMPLLAVRALRENEWIQKALLAKYPVLAVDEYQDLGRALHGMVLGLCFRAGMRLFAVGDVDQSIYGFTGAHPDLLRQLSEREDVQTVRLRLNYRCGTRIVIASEYALGEARGYEAPEGAAEGTIYFHPLHGSYEDQAEFLFSTILLGAMERTPGLAAGQVAILYPAAWIGDKVSEAAQGHGLATIRTDTNALYPRSSKLMRWLEDCALWCCDGWRSGVPRFSKLVTDGRRIFAETVSGAEERLRFQRSLITFLHDRRDSAARLSTWLVDMISELLAGHFEQSRTLGEDAEVLQAFIERTQDGGDVEGMTLGQFAGFGEGNDRLNLSSLHSAKGREFAVVVLFGMDEGRIPRPNPTPNDLIESRRLFYVGFTRPEKELHIIYSATRPSRFVTEVQERLELDN